VKEKKMKKTSCLKAFVLAMAMLFLASSLFAAAASDNSQSAGSVPVKGNIILSTTTSTQDSGLLNYLLPIFTRETGWTVDVIAVGTGAALNMGRGGDADVLLVHARADELQFVADGYGSVRYDVMYNDFLIVGPNTTAIAHNSNVLQTLRDIASRNLPFVSRGDSSGTHTMELSLWRAAGINTASVSGYSSVGQGMGATLQMASEMRTYTLTDRATWLTWSKDGRINLPAVCEGASDLLNFYGVILVNPARHPHVNVEGAHTFANWLISPSTQLLIGQFGVEQYGQALFTPNAVNPR
jgi:tungstate transport system substrate-binding protein